MLECSGLARSDRRSKALGWLYTVVTILLVLFSLGIIASILLQSGRSAGLSGAITGGAESLFGKKKGLDDFLSRLTSILVAGFLLSAVVIAFLGR